MFLSATDKQAIEAAVAALERAHGVEVVTLVAGRSDDYPETVWAAFALGAAITALVVSVVELFRATWTTSAAILWSFMAIVGIGVACALAAVYVPAFARWFLRDTRAAGEVLQYAKTQFLERELFAAPNRTAILVLVSMLERRVVILADKGLQAHVSTAQWDAVVARMTERLRAGECGGAILAGLAGIGEALAGKPIARGATDRFPNAPSETQE
ncbi:MAG: TPM domain-containing protein [Burkholderiales bacterium]|nr:TPM domain-containing protein [Burkholderiales bacterium]